MFFEVSLGFAACLSKNFFPLVWSFLLLAVGTILFTMPQKVDGYDRQSEGVVRIMSNTLSP